MDAPTTGVSDAFFALESEYVNARGAEMQLTLREPFVGALSYATKNKLAIEKKIIDFEVQHGLRNNGSVSFLVDMLARLQQLYQKVHEGGVATINFQEAIGVLTEANGSPYRSHESLRKQVADEYAAAYQAVKRRIAKDIVAHIAVLDAADGLKKPTARFEDIVQKLNEIELRSPPPSSVRSTKQTPKRDAFSCIYE